jgi:hypothetical protein
MVGQGSDHLRGHAEFGRGRRAGQFTASIDAQQAGVTTGHADHVAFALDIDAEVAVGQATTQRGYQTRTVTEIWKKLNQGLLVHNAARLLDPGIL